jgi:hypothetical protein
MRFIASQPIDVTNMFCFSGIHFHGFYIFAKKAVRIRGVIYFLSMSH